MTAHHPEDIDLVRRRVINVVGHELRTPVTTVRGLAEVAAALLEAAGSGELPPDGLDELRTVVVPALVRTARRSEDLLNDLLIATGVTTAVPVDDPVAVDLDAVAANATEDTAVRVEGQAPGPVLAHPELVRRALGHLVANADRYHDGEPTLRFATSGPQVVTDVRTPVDAPVPDLHLAFEVFFRGEGAVTRSAGIGVGLPSARALARVDGGNVEIDQADGIVSARLSLPAVV